MKHRTIFGILLAISLFIAALVSTRFPWRIAFVPVVPDKPAQVFVEAKWMENINPKEIHRSWKLLGEQKLIPEMPGGMGFWVRKFKTNKGKDALVYASVRVREHWMIDCERMAVTIFCTPPFMHAIWHKDKNKWEEVEHFEFNVDAIPHDKPWIAINFSYMPITAE